MSKFKVGDRCVILRGRTKANIGQLCTVIGPSVVHAGAIVVEMDNGFDARKEGYKLKNPSYDPADLRKIDDDHDEIPSDIRAIFSDNCDETLPEPSTRVRENGQRGEEK